MQPLVTVHADSHGTALDRWAAARGMRGKDHAETLARAMKFWVSFAMAKIPLGDAARIRTGLERIITAYETTPGGRKPHKRRGTLAAAIVYLLDWKGARALARSRSPRFYTLASKFIQARAYSANLHRAGFLPALNLLGKASGPATRLPKYRVPAGRIDHRFSDRVAHILVENFATAAAGPGPAPSGITGLAPRAFSDSWPEVEALLEKFLREDAERAAKSAGFDAAS
jgi:hypothetical protein